MLEWIYKIVMDLKKSGFPTGDDGFYVTHFNGPIGRAAFDNIWLSVCEELPHAIPDAVGPTTTEFSVYSMKFIWRAK